MSDVMPTERLFDIADVPEIPLFREPRCRRGVLISDARLSHDYPPEWSRCPTCSGSGDGPYEEVAACADCLGMGSLKAMARLVAGHRCVRCRHPFMPKGDAKMLGVAPSPGHWSPCDEGCTHGGPVRILVPEGDAPFETGEWMETTLLPPFTAGGQIAESGQPYEAEWRILTVHHLDGDKANCRWWNLAALCQRCHLEIQAKVVIERVWPHEHSVWFRPYAAGYYAYVYLGKELTRDEVDARMDELLELEATPT